MNIVLFQPCGEGTENRLALEHCSICSLSWLVKKWSLSRLVSVGIHHFYVRSSDNILMLCPLWHSLILCCGFTFCITSAGHLTNLKDIQYFLTLPLSRCPCTLSMPLFVIINFWLVQSVTVSEFQDNWQVLVSQVWKACLCCRNHWAMKLSEWITSGSADRELVYDWMVGKGQTGNHAFTELSKTCWWHV